MSFLPLAGTKAATGPHMITLELTLHARPCIQTPLAAESTCATRDVQCGAKHMVFIRKTPFAGRREHGSDESHQRCLCGRGLFVRGSCGHRPAVKAQTLLLGW